MYTTAAVYGTWNVRIVYCAESLAILSDFCLVDAVLGSSLEELTRRKCFAETFNGQRFCSDDDGSASL